MKPVSLADITYDQGLQLLALRKQAMDSGRIRRMTPEALANTFPLNAIGQSLVEKLADDGLLESLKTRIGGLTSQLGAGAQGLKDQWSKLDPSARQALATSLAGAGAGAATGAVSAKRRGAKGVGRSAIRGGLAGAALGGGLSLALNPGLADKAQGKAQAILERAQAQAKPSADAAPAAPAAPSASDISKLTATANSSTPELAALASGAGIAAGTGAGYKILRDRTSYDPQRLYDHIKNLTKDVKKKKGQPGPSTKELIDPVKLKATFGAGGEEMTDMGHGPNMFGKMRGAPGRVGTTKDILANLLPEDKLEPALRAANTSGFFNTPPPQAPSLSLRGGLNKANLNRLGTEGKAYATGLGNAVRPGRAAGLAALAGTGLLAAGSTGLNYLHNRGLRSDAAEQLQQLNSSQP
jgi:hypothetical protein